MANVKKVQTDQGRKKHKSKDKSKKFNPKVREVQTDQVRKKHKSKDKSKKSKLENVKTEKTSLEKVENQPGDPAPSSHVQESQVARETTTNKPAEQSQMVRRIRHKSMAKSQPSKVLHSSLVKIAEYVQLAREAAGRTISAAHTQDLRRSINSGISAALNEVQMSGTLESAQSIEQKLRGRVLESIEGRSRYTTNRQVLVTLNNFIQALKVQVTAAEQSAENQEKKNRKVHRTRPQDSQGKWNNNTTFSRDIILIIWRRNILVHLRAMNKEAFLSVVELAFQRASPHADSSRALRWLSHPTITDSGNVKVTIHTKDPKELDMVTEDMITAWAMVLQNEVEQSSRVFEVLVPNFPVEPINLTDSGRKAETIERLVRTNAATISSLTKPDDIRDIQMAKANGRASWAIAIVITFDVCALANNVIENGLYWNGEHYKCEALGASELLERCERCQLYAHTANSCTNTIRCGKCSQPHFTRSCKSTEFACAVCSGPHPAYSEACPARNAAREEIQKVRFAPDSEENYLQLTTACTHHGKSICKAPELQGMVGTKEAGLTGSHPHSRDVHEKLRRLREEVVALEEELAVESMG